MEIPFPTHCAIHSTRDTLGNRAGWFQSWALACLGTVERARAGCKSVARSPIGVGSGLAWLLVASIGCGDAASRDPCDPIDPVLADASFVVVVEPTAGLRSSSPLRVRGCSRTFESNLVWKLRSRNGSTLASGHASGGGVSGAAAFAFSADFAVSAAQVGHLEVFEPDESDGEGFPAARSVIPLVLLPGSKQAVGSEGADTAR